MARPRHIVLMGVSGNGKTTIGSWLARDLDHVFLEGDDFHPQANIDKMSAGEPLTDDDRYPWLDILAAEIRRLEEGGQGSILACSALRRQYRDRLRKGYDGLFFLHLDGTYETILQRMQRREHYMPPSLLTSQFETLESLDDDERGAVVNIEAPPDQVVLTALSALNGTHDAR